MEEVFMECYLSLLNNWFFFMEEGKEEAIVYSPVYIVESRRLQGIIVVADVVFEYEWPNGAQVFECLAMREWQYLKRN